MELSSTPSRPLGSGQSRSITTRPGTAARPQTAASTRHEGSYVIALLESRGVAHEVGIAAMDRDTGRVMLVQLADCPTYVKTLHQMHIHYPSLVLVPDTFIAATDATLASAAKKPPTTSLLVQFIMEEFPNIPVEPVARKYWNDGAGMDFITQLCVENDERAATLVSASDKYYALSATCALFKYCESRLNTRFSSGSLRIRYASVEGTMLIDPETAKNLELVKNVMHKKSSHTLFGVLNHTYTAMASRLLRTNILAPLTAVVLTLCTELIQNEDRFSQIRDALKYLNKLDFDKLISSLATLEVRPSNSAKFASTRVSQMLSLQIIIRNLPFLQKVLANSKSQLLQVIHEMISDNRLALIADLITDNLNDAIGPSKGGLAAVNARVYAVKANRNRLLDVARETFKENVGDIYQLNSALSEKHGLPITLVYQESGFVFAMKKDELEGELPKGFLNISAQKGRWIFSSMELKKLNARMKDALDETLILSDKIIQELLVEVLSHSGALYTASEAVALIDLLWSFAHTSIIRPEFTGTLAVKSGRHPILETVHAAGTLVANDIYCCDASHFQIIQGPNMSGKSTYLRQTGLLVIVAMCGCFVPADYASFRIHDALLSRLSNDDDMEKNLSTFANEITSSAMIIGLATPKTLVLVDELGRGTSPSEGVGIAHAIAEELIKIKCFVLFATHFHELSTTLSRQPSVVNLHLSVQRTRKSSSSLGMVFKYKIMDGLPEDLDHYGLELARLADLPSDLIIEGRRVANALAGLHARREEESQTTIVATRRRAVVKLRSQLTQALDHSTLPEEELVAYLARFQKDLIQVFHETS
ncbi:muts domain V-domain-containing protein [Boletus edulis BED1]|uniref:DNA mismatch repair protein MSH3 n=1 Tax=Boletus edulis BED1 TaxID=1328754 RepID=A0AAD4BU29_BOLED|nr:muts domain V-domain-containing protein [Boletus edulis BED1]